MKNIRTGYRNRLLGKPQVTIEATTTKVDVAALYLRAMQAVNAEMQPASGDAVEEKANEIDAGKNIQIQ